MKTALWLTGAMVALALTPPAIVAAPRQAGAGPAPAAQASPAATDRAAYVLGAGDKLRITVFGETNLTGEYAVTGDGIVSFPLIGSVRAAGQTLEQVETAIRTRLAAGYINDPRVAIEVIEFRTFYILGEVNKPGEYPYRTNLTVDQAVATAGGYTYRANRRRFAIAHTNDSAETRQSFKDSGRLRVEPGDTIRILERFF